MSNSHTPIPFNRPFIIGNELQYIQEAIQKGKISGNGHFTKKCHHFFEQHYHFKKTLLTTSCTDALEMTAILLDIQPNDEVIMPSYTFVSTANAFVLRGAKIVFADSLPNHPNIDPSQIEALITSKTRAIVVVHYAGVACDMDAIQAIADKHDLFVIEDAAQSIDSFYKEKPLGGIGDLAAFSFHETKNIIAGEGGMLTVNKPQFSARAEIIWEKGTNRSAFFRGEVNKYGWMDVGSSFLPSEITAAFLYAQLEQIQKIQEKRKAIWKRYFEAFQVLEKQGKYQIPSIPSFATNNGHLFYLVCNDAQSRNRLIQTLRKQNIHAVFHYLSLHKSSFYASKHDGRKLPNADHFTECLVRLPLYYDLTVQEQDYIIKVVGSV